MSRVRTEPSRSHEGPKANELVAVPAPIVALENGRYRVQLNALGAGYSDWGGVAVTRWAADKTCEADGFHVYLRDLDHPTVWSVGFLPTCVEPDRYEFRRDGGVAQLVRRDREIECALAIGVSAEHDCEWRSCQLTNHGGQSRRIELTSYLEWVLARREADANHPAFSKLFIETQFCAKRAAIIARRRPRSADDCQVYGFHSLVGEDSRADVGDVSFETNRVVFVGRGRTLSRPQALDQGVALTGCVGPVLDPIGSLRTSVTIEPGESRRVVFLLGAGANHEAIDTMLAAFSNMAATDAVFPLASAGSQASNSGVTARVTHERTRRAGERIIFHSRHIAPPEAYEKAGENVFHAATQGSHKYTVPARSFPAPLQFANGFGGFSADGREYVVRLRPDGAGGHHRPPMPWVNVVANERAGFTVSESGAGCTWAGNSRLNRLTAWYNDPVCDPHSEAVWIRDEDAGEFWSVTPGPTPAPVDYTVHHGFGYTRFEHESRNLFQEATMFVVANEPVKITRLRLVNRSTSPRRLSLFAYVHWALGGLAAETVPYVSTHYDAELQAVLATNAERETYGRHVAFSATVAGEGTDVAGIGYTCDRTAFIGYAGELSSPAALKSSHELDGRAGSGLDPCAAWRVPIELPPGGECEISLLLGEATSREEAAALLESLRAPARTAHALSTVKKFWRETVSAISIETPDREIDLVVNGWLTYQNLSCRMWGRSAYYQPGGAFGFRDQLQDAAALMAVRPDITRQQIIRHAGQQFVEGDVLHWWHPDNGYGLRTTFSDDLLWLPYVTASYVQSTGDAVVLEDDAPFVVGPAIAEGHVEAYLRPLPTESHGTIYEHCCRALDRGLTTGVHGLPLIGCGDWNDGFSRVGHLGRGESVWLGFFVHHVLGSFLPICEQRGDDERVARYTAYRQRLAAALNTDGWDGSWYRRAYYDNGQPLGSARSDECQIDALAQAWAVLSGVAPPERARMAMDAVEQRLVCRDVGIVKLLAPPFDRTTNDPGYIKGYLPGIRENGGQYTHGVLWVVRALAEIGRGTAAVDLLTRMTPVWHAATAERVAVYQTEPYVVAADIYGMPPHVGRGGWTWYTGSAGWMFRIAVESIMGLTIDRGGALVVKPAISSSWPGCQLTYRLPGEATTYKIRVENPHGKEFGVTSASFDGEALAIENGAARIPLVHDGGAHQVVVWL